MYVLVRTTGNPSALVQPLNTAVAQVDRDLPLFDVKTMDERLSRSLATSRFNTLLLTLLGAIGLALAATGIYSVIAYFVSQRTQEIGVRMAIGATRTSVVGLVLRDGMTWAGGGIVLGLLGAWSVSRAMASVLFDISAADPLTFAVTALVLAGVSGLACTVPAIRATRIDPVIALRGD
jgi:putative ABC transport system permease protein